MRLEGLQTLHPVPPSPAMDPGTAAQVSAITLKARSTQGTLAAGTNAKHRAALQAGSGLQRTWQKDFLGKAELKAEL